MTDRTKTICPPIFDLGGIKTAISTVSNGVNTTVTHILLDEGSQKSFITEEIAQRLKLTPCGLSTLSIAAFGDATRNVRKL